MRKFSLLESLTTKYFVPMVFFIIIGTISVLLFTTANNYIDIDTLATYVDIAVKVLAILIGATWTLNRYFMGRLDGVQIRVDSDVAVVRDKSFKNKDLLTYRLDIVNTGQVFIPSLSYSIIIDEVMPSENTEPIYKTLYKLPESGFIQSGHIEPKSWAAVSDALSIPKSVKAVRITIDIKVYKEHTWSWHKIFSLKD